MNALGLVRGFHSANDWEQLGEVADWLRTRGVRDGELLCWDDSPHALYLELGIRPAFRFQHVGQMAGISLNTRRGCGRNCARWRGAVGGADL